MSDNQQSLAGKEELERRLTGKIALLCFPSFTIWAKIFQIFCFDLWSGQNVPNILIWFIIWAKIFQIFGFDLLSGQKYSKHFGFTDLRSGQKYSKCFGSSVKHLGKNTSNIFCWKLSHQWQNGLPWALWAVRSLFKYHLLHI